MSMGGRIGSKVGSEVWAAALPFFSVAAKSEKEEEGRVEVETLEEGTVGALGGGVDAVIGKFRRVRRGIFKYCA